MFRFYRRWNLRREFVILVSRLSGSRDWFRLQLHRRFLESRRIVDKIVKIVQCYSITKDITQNLSRLCATYFQMIEIGEIGGLIPNCNSPPPQPPTPNFWAKFSLEYIQGGWRTRFVSKVRTPWNESLETGIWKSRNRETNVADHLWSGKCPVSVYTRWATLASQIDHGQPVSLQILQGCNVLLQQSGIAPHGDVRTMTKGTDEDDDADGYPDSLIRGTSTRNKDSCV